MSVQFPNALKEIAEELQHFQKLFFEMLDSYLRTIHGDGIYDVKISKRGNNAWKPQFEDGLIVTIQGAAGLVDQYALAEQMMLFWGDRVEKLQATIKAGGG